MAILITIGVDFTIFAESAENNIAEEGYSTIIKKWDEQGIKDVDGTDIKITPLQFVLGNENKLLSKEDSQGYNTSVAHLNKDDEVELTVNVNEEGLYNINFDYYTLTSGLTSNEGDIQVNGSYQYNEAKRIVFSTLWGDSTKEFARDRYNNEVMPEQKKVSKWQNTYLIDSSNIEPGNLKLELKKGENKIKITLNSGEILLGDIHVQSPVENIDYSEYKGKYSNEAFPKDKLVITEAEKVTYKNDTSINAVVSRDSEVVPYETNALLLNTIGGKTWQKGGQAVYYNIDVPESGLYKIAFKYLQAEKANSITYRTITMDGEIPFKELEHYKFDYANKWQTEILGNGKEDYYFYLTKGVHTLGLEADITPYNDLINVISDSIEQVNHLTLQIKKLVGSTVDENRDWEISDYIPNIQTNLNKIADSLNKQYESGVKLNNGNENSQGLISVKTAITLLRELAKEPNDIPKKLSQLSEGTGSVTQSLSEAMDEFEKQPLTIDEFYVYSKDKQLPDYNSSLFKKLSEGVKRFIYSFVPQKDKTQKETVTLNVWVNRSRNYIDLMQKMADEQFTPKTNIKINFSLMPNEQKLILANASGTSPDIALGISNWLPYELGIRGAAADLRQFSDFDSYISKFSPGAIIPMVVDDKVYGIPETQDFYVMFYRKDILKSLNIPVPDTWQDVKNILPELQRHGMNFYTNLSGASGTKPFTVTAPFIYQNGGDMYTSDGMSTALDSEKSLTGIKLMTDLFTIYDLPEQAPNFFEHFRSGTLPIGIGTFYTYVQMMNAAPELKGSWAIAPAPGIKDSTGQVVRWQPGSAQSCMMFKDSKYQNESWEFMKWWMDTDTQTQFENQIQTLYGGEYMWNTANLEAFKQLPMAEEDKNVVLEQWKWLMEVPKIPGGYMVERELSNVWTSVVFNGKNLRSSVDEAVITINKEISRKMEEFGYLKDGKVVKSYKVPTIKQVEGWVKNASTKK